MDIAVVTGIVYKKIPISYSPRGLKRTTMKDKRRRRKAVYKFMRFSGKLHRFMGFLVDAFFFPFLVRWQNFLYSFYAFGILFILLLRHTYSLKSHDNDPARIK